MQVDIVKSDPDIDAPLLYDNLREEDMLECLGLMTHPRDAVYGSFETSSKCYSVKSSDFGLLCCFGVSPRDNVGVCWLLGTRDLCKIKKQFVRESVKWVNELMIGYDYLTNYVMKANTLSMRWLNWLGADFNDCQYDGYMSFILERN